MVLRLSTTCDGPFSRLLSPDRSPRDPLPGHGFGYAAFLIPVQENINSTPPVGIGNSKRTMVQGTVIAIGYLRGKSALNSSRRVV